MKVYQLKVEIGFATDDPEHFSNVYTNYDKALEDGKKFLEKNVTFVFTNGEYNIKNREIPSIDELFSIERVWYEFNIEEIEDIEYAENFNIKLVPNEAYLEQNIKPTHKVYHLDYKGNIESIDIQYRASDKEHPYGRISMKPDDFKKGAGEKFKIGDVVTVKKDEYRSMDSETYVGKRLYVVRWLPKRVKGSIYFENTYALISNYYDGLFIHGERENNIEKYEGKIAPESPIGFLQRIIKKEVTVTEEIWNDMKIGKILLDDRSNYKELLKKKE
jgi:hypothetical protein